MAVLVTVVTVRRCHGVPVHHLSRHRLQVAAQTQNTCIAISAAQLARSRPCRQERKVRFVSIPLQDFFCVLEQ